MGKFIARARMTEVFCVVRDKSKADSCGVLAAGKIRVGFDQNGIIYAISVAVGFFSLLRAAPHAALLRPMSRPRCSC